MGRLRAGPLHTRGGNMKRLLAISILVLAACGSTQMSRDMQSGADASCIKQANADFATAMRTNDFDAITNTYTADATFMPPNMPAAHGQSAIRTAGTAFFGQCSSTDIM